MKDIFNSIPVAKGFANVLPPDYQVRPPTTAAPSSAATQTSPSPKPETTTTTPIFEDDVSAFLPPGYSLSTTSTSTESTLVAEIFRSISIEDIDDSLLPQEFKEKHKNAFTTSKFKPSNPRPPRPRGPPRSRKEDNTVAKASRTLKMA